MFNVTWNSLRSKCISIGSISTTFAWAGLSLYHIISGSEAPAYVYYPVYLGVGILGAAGTYVYVKFWAADPLSDIVPDREDKKPVIIEEQALNRILIERPNIMSSTTPYFKAIQSKSTLQDSILSDSQLQDALLDPDLRDSLLRDSILSDSQLETAAKKSLKEPLLKSFQALYEEETEMTNLENGLLTQEVPDAEPSPVEGKVHFFEGKAPFAIQPNFEGQQHFDTDASSIPTDKNVSLYYSDSQDAFMPRKYR